MAGTAAFKLNLAESKWGLFNRVPLNLPTITSEKRRLKPSARGLLEKIFAFTRRKGDDLTGCRVTYDQMIAEIGRGRSTVASAFEELKSEGLIKKLDRDVDGTEYVYVGEPTSGKFYIIPLYLYTMEIFSRDEGTYQKLTMCDVHVLAYLMTECASPMNGGNAKTGRGVCKTSYKKLSRILHFSTKAIRDSIYRLMKARIVYRPERYKGINGKKLSRYEVNSGLYLYKKYAKKAPNKEEETKARVEYYAELREQAKRRAANNFDYVKRNASFRNNRAQSVKVITALCRAEIDGNSIEAKKLKKRVDALEQERVRILESFGLTDRDLYAEKQCSCDRCKDYGKLPNGEWCTCYPGGAL